MRPLTATVVLMNVVIVVTGLVYDGAVDTIDFVLLAMVVAFSATGAAVATRQRRNAIGWLFLGVGTAAALAGLTGGIADHDLAHQSPVTEVAAAYSTASWIPFMLPGLTFLLLLFPDGRPLSPRWRVVAWCAGAGILTEFAGTLVKPGPLEDYPNISNPLGAAWGEPLEGLGALLLLIALVAAPIAAILRFRRAGSLERLQIKWLALAGAVAVATFMVGLLCTVVISGGSGELLYFPMMATVVALPVAAGVAILRYRLYDIDVVINRTLVYTGLTGTLVAAYLGTVLVAQLVLSPLAEESDLAIAVSTLAVAALFQPARRRIQAIVDRRFFRRRYDAERTLVAFGTRLRDEVDLEALSAELSTVVFDTMQPAHVSVWLARS